MNQATRTLVFHPKRPTLSSAEHQGRESIVQKIFDRLATEDVQSCAVIGFSRAGKTSLINYLRQPDVLQKYLRELAKTYHFIYLDAANLTLDSEQAFLRHFYAEINQHLGLTELQGPRDFERVNGWLKQNDRRLVCIFDNFNLIVNHPGYRVQFYEGLRAWFYDQDRVGCILTSPVQLLNLSMSRELASSPFFNIFTTYVLGPLKLAEAMFLLESRLPEPLKSRDRDIFELIENVGTTPYLLQLAGEQWVNYYDKTGKSAFSNAIEEIYQASMSYHEEVYASLKTRQLETLAGLLRGIPQEPDNALIDRGLVDKEGQKVVTKQFERFLRQRFGLTQSRFRQNLSELWQKIFG